MKILVLGAGVIGSLYAAKLHDAGEDVTLFARGSRYDQLRSGSVSLRDASTGRVTFRRVPVTGELAPSDGYELIIISVRLDQLDPVLDLVRRHTAHPLVLCMCNNPDGVDEVAASLAPRKVIFGFPGAGGARMGDTIRFLMIPRQKTTLGTADGRPSGELQRVKALLETAGFKTAATTRIGAWLRVHAVFMSAVSAAICQAGGDAARLGSDKKAVAVMVKAVREGFRACLQLGVPVVPSNLKTIFLTMPRWFSVRYWQGALKGPTGTLAMAPHATAAPGEMRLIAQKVLSFVHSSSVATPTLDYLLSGFIKQSLWHRK